MRGHEAELRAACLDVDRKPAAPLGVGGAGRQVEGDLGDEGSVLDVRQHERIVVGAVDARQDHLTVGEADVAESPGREPRRLQVVGLVHRHDLVRRAAGGKRVEQALEVIELDEDRVRHRREIGRALAAPEHDLLHPDQVRPHRGDLGGDGLGSRRDIAGLDHAEDVAHGADELRHGPGRDGRREVRAEIEVARHDGHRAVVAAVRTGERQRRNGQNEEEQQRDEPCVCHGGLLAAEETAAGQQPYR